MYEHPYHTTDLSKFSILITGGAGFIGSNLVEYLIKFNVGKIRVLDNLSTGYLENLKPYLNTENFEFIEGDIRNLETCQNACQGIDFVLHQAALGSVPRSIKDPITTNDVNIGGFLNILIASRDQNVKRLVYAASSSTYGDSKELPKLEDKIGKPLSPYAVTKYVNELYADVFSKTYGLETIGLRYFNVFGPKQSPNGEYAAVIPLFIQAAIDNKPATIYGDGNTSRDFTFIENVVQANIKSIFINDKNALNQIYNIAFGQQTTLLELFKLINMEIANNNIQPIMSDKRNGDINHSLASVSKAKEYLGYLPLYNLKDGLKITYSTY
jgi:UDP-N-acetylglucosamine/UDP-N-acetylgalactosamine 4-epimerase